MSHRFLELQRPRWLAICVLVVIAYLPIDLALSQDAACPTTDTTIPEDSSSNTTKADISDPHFDLYADEVVAEADNTLHVSGKVSLAIGERSLSANEVWVDTENGSVRAVGKVSYEDANVLIQGQQAQIYQSTDISNFIGAGIELKDSPIRAQAARISRPDKNTLVLENVTYTSCPKPTSAEDIEDWMLIAPKIILDQEHGVAIGRNVWLRFFNVPVLYTPYISFPINNKRRSGILAPALSSDQRSGVQFGIPFYWNIAPNYDALLTPQTLQKRGFKLDSTWRYLTSHSSGSLETEYLPHDSIVDDDRGVGRWINLTEWDNGWSIDNDVTDLSDLRYFDDLGTSLVASNLTHIDRWARIRFNGDHHDLSLRWQNYLTLDDTLTADQRPYERLPQLELHSRWPSTSSGSLFGIDQEWVNFERGVGVNGVRVNLEPYVRWSWHSPAAYITPEARWRYTHYQLENDPFGSDSLSRSLPQLSVDSGLTFERNASRDGAWRQTLQPRLKYTHIPFHNQDNFPVFDTSLSDFNFYQLFDGDRFSGIDRISDTDKLSFALSTEFVNQNSGNTAVQAAIGQAWYLSSQAVQLPDETEPVANRSDVITEVMIPIGRLWRGGLEHQWNSETQVSDKSVVSLQYRPQNDRLLNFGYRFRRGELEQTDLSAAWQFDRHWGVVGRWNYSWRDDSTLESFAGLEYQTCCWRFRLVGRQFVNDSGGGRENAIFAQLELGGLLSVGTRLSDFLESGILGYQDQ